MFFCLSSWFVHVYVSFEYIVIRLVQLSPPTVSELQVLTCNGDVKDQLILIFKKNFSIPFWHSNNLKIYVDLYGIVPQGAVLENEVLIFSGFMDLNDYRIKSKKGSGNKYFHGFWIRSWVKLYWSHIVYLIQQHSGKLTVCYSVFQFASGFVGILYVSVLV